MPKVNTPEISKGFWITIGVVLALFLIGLANMALRRVRNQGA